MFRVPFFMSSRDARNTEVIYRCLLASNYKFRLGRFGLDPESSKVVLLQGIPIDNFNPTTSYK